MALQAQGEEQRKAGSEGPAMTGMGASGLWVVLAALAVIGWWLAGSGWGAAAVAAMIVLAGIKIYLVMGGYMGVWRAPLWCHAMAIGWVAVVCGAIAVLALGRPA